jgi:hypothetical protein
MNGNGAVAHHSDPPLTALVAGGFILTPTFGPYDGPTGTGGRGTKGNVWN